MDSEGWRILQRVQQTTEGLKAFQYLLKIQKVISELNQVICRRVHTGGE
jgi:hypothetical protein